MSKSKKGSPIYKQLPISATEEGISFRIHSTIYAKNKVAHTFQTY